MKTIKEVLDMQLNRGSKRDNLTKDNAFIVWLIDEIYEAMDGYTEQEEADCFKDIYQDATEHEALLGLIYYRQQEDLFHRYQKDILQLVELFHNLDEYEYHLGFANKTPNEIRGLFFVSSIQALTTLAWFMAFQHIMRIIARERGEHPLQRDADWLFQQIDYYK